MNHSTKSDAKFRYNNKNWFGKLSAALVLGFTLTIGLTGLLLHYGFGHVGIFSSHGQFLMWLVSPIWLSILSFCFLFRTGLHAWIYLLSANALIWGTVVASPLLKFNSL